MRRLSIAVLIAAALAAVSVSAAGAQVLGKPNPGPPPQAQFYAAWNGSSSCVFSELAATCTNTASAWWTNAPTVRWVEFDFSCSDNYDDACGPFNPQDILVSSHVNGSSSGSANTAFNFTQLGCGAGYSFDASFFDARGHYLGHAASSYTGAGYYC